MVQLVAAVTLRICVGGVLLPTSGAATWTALQHYILNNHIDQLLYLTLGHRPCSLTHISGLPNSLYPWWITLLLLLFIYLTTVYTIYTIYIPSDIEGNVKQLAKNKHKVVRLLFLPIWQSLIDYQLSDNPGLRPGGRVAVLHTSLKFL